jgi:TP901 family phage tail tape measure protein
MAGLAGALGGFGLLRGLREASKTIAGFQESMLRLRGVTGLVDPLSEEFERLEKQSRRLGATTRFTAKEAGEGQLFLARAGFQSQEILQAMPHAMNLASVGMIELGESADITSNILRQFNLSATQTERVVDVLTTTVHSSNTDIRQLAEALKFAGPVANSLGISVEETAAAIGAMGDAGIQASLAGTNLRGVLASLVDVTPKGKAALEGMELAIADLKPQTNSLADIFDALRESGFGAEQALALFMRRNQAGALVLSQSVAKLRELEQAYQDQKGVTASAAELIESGLSGAFRTLRSATEEAYLAAGDEGLGGALEDLVDGATAVIRELSGSENAMEGLTSNAEHAATAIKAVAVAVGAMSLALLATPVGIAVAALAAIGLGAFKLSQDFADADKQAGNLADTLRRLQDAGSIVSDTVGSGQSRVLQTQIERLKTGKSGLVSFGIGSATSSGALDPVVEASKIREIVRSLAIPQDLRDDLIEYIDGLSRMQSILVQAGGVTTQFTTDVLTSANAVHVLGEALETIALAAGAKAPAELAADVAKQAERDQLKALQAAEDLKIAQGDLVALWKTRAQASRMTQHELDVEKAKEEALALAKSRNIAQSEELVKLAVRLAAQQGELNAERQADDLIEQLQTEVAFLKAEGDAVADLTTKWNLLQTQLSTGVNLEDADPTRAEWIESLQREIERLRREQGLTDTTRLKPDYERRFSDDAVERWKVELQDVQELYAGLGQISANAFGQMLLGQVSVTAGLKNLGAQLASLILQQLVLKRLADAISYGIGGRSGGGGIAAPAIPATGEQFGAAFGTFGDRSVDWFQFGGIFRQPHMFMHSGGRRGVLGEFREEAAVPLVKTSSGHLGVRQEGGGGVSALADQVAMLTGAVASMAGSRPSITVNQKNYGTPEATFRKSKRQVAAEYSRIMSGR